MALMEFPNTFTQASNPWLAMMNSTGIAQQQAACNQANQQLSQLLGGMAQMQQQAAIPAAYYNQLAANTVTRPPELHRHTAKELAAFAIAWAFGDEGMAPLIATDMPGASGGLRAPSGIDLLRNYQGEPTHEQLLMHQAQLLAAKPWFWPVVALFSAWDLFSWVHHLL